MVHDTPSHGSDHLCLIWKESIHNCRWYRADTACGTDGRTDGQTDGRTDRRTDGRTEWNQYTPPTTSLCGGYNYDKTIISNQNQNWSYMIIVKPAATDPLVSKTPQDLLLHGWPTFQIQIQIQVPSLVNIRKFPAGSRLILVQINITMLHSCWSSRSNQSNPIDWETL